MSSVLVRAFGWPAPLFHGDTAVLDRWLWLRNRLPRDDGSKRVLDIGCGSGAFSIGTAKRGYTVLGLTWDGRDKAVAAERARMCGAHTVKFETQDVRALDVRVDLRGKYDVVILCEVVEHILDDGKLMRDAAACLKPGGKLLLTTPNAFLKPIDPAHEGPFPLVEDGGHVRKGYTEERLTQLCRDAGLTVGEVSYCTGYLSQKITYVHFKATKVHPVLGWAVIHPFRLLPPLFDDWLTRKLKYPAYSICLEASKEVASC
jgi:2-polyprenyl-3-methyl-5-hydroxy-6-metoxy-1,4-benzoquinol methylase